MFYKICRFFNLVLSCLFLTLVIFAVFGASDFPEEMILAMVIIIIIAAVFILFDLICGKFYKLNKEQVSATSRLKNTGKILFVFNLLCAIAICGIAFAAFSVFLSSDSEKMQRQSIIYYTMFSVFILGGITAIVNLFLFSQLLRNNKVIATKLVEDIGKYN